MQRWDDALASLNTLRQLQPDNRTLDQLELRIRSQAQQR
jgi:hypothetical protein